MIKAMGGGFTWGSSVDPLVAGFALPAWLDKLVDRAFAPSMDMIPRAPTGIAYLGMTLQLAAFRSALPDGRRRPLHHLAYMSYLFSEGLRDISVSCGGRNVFSANGVKKCRVGAMIVSLSPR
jgi:hypothetical protein